MKVYIPHPVNIPIEYEVGEKIAGTAEQLETCKCGLSFRASRALPVGTMVMVRIPHLKPAFRARGVVVWCEFRDSHFEIGLKFPDRQTAFRIRLLEQICHIEAYQQEVWQSEGRRLSKSDAAAEWIHKFAWEFPNIA